MPPETREARVAGIGAADGARVLVATDCLSEGINLQEYFDAVVHYDLSWNPTRHEQREGRVDRFGQPSRTVRATLLYGANNPVDGAVLQVILRKAARIREELGVPVPVPDEGHTLTLHNVPDLSDIRTIDVVYMQAASPEAVPDVVEGVSRVIAQRHRNLSNFKIESLDQYLVLAQRVSRAVTVGLIAIAAVSLLVGGIGIMNIMLVTVSERTSDIGIRLALGAGQRAIMVQFLLEASILSLIGGVLGIIIGAVLPVYAGLLYGVSVPVSGLSVAVAFTVSVGVGLFFGYYPARKAASMNIVDALGYT